MPSAYLLVSHGSRDSRPQASVELLAKLMCERAGIESNILVTTHCFRSTASPSVETRNFASPLVGTACLELAPMPLHAQIQEFGKQALAFGYNRLQVLPLFLLPGVHVMEDIPTEVAIAQATFGSDLQIDIQPYLGSHPGLVHLLANELAGVFAPPQSSLKRKEKRDGLILLSHGSRRAGGNQPAEAIAKKLGAKPAYWSVSPSLESRIEELVESGYDRIGIQPYFLFPGGITDAIASSVAQYQLQFPSTSLHLAEPIGTSAELADLIWDLTRKSE